MQDSGRLSLSAYSGLLRDNRNFRLLWLAQIVSELGDMLYTIVIYSLGVRYFYPGMGLVLGTLMAYALAMVSAYFTAIFIQVRLA